MGQITVSESAPQNYHDSLDILNQSETFRDLVDRTGNITLTSDPVYSGL